MAEALAIDVGKTKVMAKALAIVVGDALVIAEALTTIVGATQVLGGAKVPGVITRNAGDGRGPVRHHCKMHMMAGALAIIRSEIQVVAEARASSQNSRS